MRLNYEERVQDIFELDDKIWYKGVCISADFALNSGISKEFDRHYNMRSKLTKGYNYQEREFPDVILIDNVFNLVNKVVYYKKPDIPTMVECIKKLDRLLIEHSVRYLAIPSIGCDSDGLEWYKVRNVIKDIMHYTECTLLVCHSPYTVDRRKTDDTSKIIISPNKNIVQEEIV